MSSSMQLLFRRLSIAVSAALVITVVPLVCAQESSENPIRVTPAAQAGYSLSNFHYHILPANTPAGKNARGASKYGTAVPKNKPLASIASVPSPGFYPDDLVYFGGPVVKDMQSHSVYLNASSCGGVAKCWGNPEKFLTDLGRSKYIHVTDQYTGTSGNYTNGTHVFASLTMYTNMIDESDLFGLVHDAAATLGTPSGYGHEFHVFLPPGVDTCFDETSECYSPDNPSSFVFCAYHGSITFSDIGHVLFSVQPNQNVPGCQAAPPDPNGILQDSTDSVLAHETIETITDPDIDAWISDSSLLSSGAEIADLCEPTGNASAQFLDSIVSLDGVKYELQLMYSNHYHACSPQ